MELKHYLKGLREADPNFREKHFAKFLGIANQTLSLIKNYKQQPSIHLCKKIEKATDGLVEGLQLMELCYQSVKQKKPKRKSL